MIAGVLRSSGNCSYLQRMEVSEILLLGGCRDSAMPRPLVSDGGEPAIKGGDFLEQAEYISEQDFLSVSEDHPDESAIIRRLSAGGAKLLVGPRGCGKTTLLLKTYFSLLRAEAPNTLPVYVNFKLSLKLEPLYVKTANASFWFKRWLNLRILSGIYKTVNDSTSLILPPAELTHSDVEQILSKLERGEFESLQNEEAFSVTALTRFISKTLAENHLSRCILLLDDAAHAFSSRQQEDFFDFFREIKSKEISPKAAIYPGITVHSPSFQVGHDAEQIDAWVRPTTATYLAFMRRLAIKRFSEIEAHKIFDTPQALDFLAYASFGIPRSFLNMIRAMILEMQASGSASADRRKLFEVARQSRETAHSVYDSLAVKVPSYKDFISTGNEMFQHIISSMKEFNRNKDDLSQALEFGLKRPISVQMDKVISFYQYAGLLMPNGLNSRGEKGSYDRYLVHFGDLITDNAIIARRSKAVSSFVSAFESQAHRPWPSIAPDTLVRPSKYAEMFKLSLPTCQHCGAERASQDARFCQHCGAQLKTTSLYDELTNKGIDVLPLSDRMVARIIEHSSIRTVKDILIDSDRQQLRNIHMIGPIRAKTIIGYAEEYVA